MVAAVMFQGTGSDVGKSLLVAGLARAFTQDGLRVRPFKPQNMSNNAAVTADGGEIGRAQALQARACGVDASSDMNPVLLKPQAGNEAQIIVRGQVVGKASGRDYQAMKPGLLDAVLGSFATIGEDADLVLVEGAGSASEVNLRQGDIANMGFAEAADLPVILIGDIDRGGVIASLIGTHAVLPPAERGRLKGYLINKFRGDQTLFEPALETIRQHTHLECLGMVPWFADAALLPPEDSVALTARHGTARTDTIVIAVPVLPHIANFDDLDPLMAEDGVSVVMVQPGETIPVEADLIILAGSKATIADLAALRAQGWDIDLKAHWRRRRPILGLCGGYQMLGRRIADPDGIEGPVGSTDGLGLIKIDTVLAPTKHLARIETGFGGVALSGYEMHMGETTGADRARPFLDNGDGAISADGLIAGCYLHGIFASDAFRTAYLSRLRSGFASSVAYDRSVELVLNRLADHLRGAIDLDRLLRIARCGC
jgi:adenosylcobyric acid synthase